MFVELIVTSPVTAHPILVPSKLVPSLESSRALNTNASPGLKVALLRFCAQVVSDLDGSQKSFIVIRLDVQICSILKFVIAPHLNIFEYLNRQCFDSAGDTYS